jgi:hypothetical protein
VLATLIMLAATEGHESSKTLFYVVGGALGAFGFLIGGIGIARHRAFPPSPAAARGVMALAVVLVAATVVSAVLTS